jgi:hypothetical protein
VPFGATPDRSCVEFTGDGRLRVRFGWLFDHSFALADVEGAGPRHAPFWWGVGWRTDLRGRITLLGSHEDCVELRFREPRRVNMIVPLRCSRLVMSLSKPDEFLAAMAPHGVAVE